MQAKEKPDETLEYVCKIFKHFGLTTPSPEEFRQAKLNQADKTAMNKFLLLVYEISLLHLTDYKFKFTKVQKNLHNVDQQVEKVTKYLIYYLHNMNCPFLVILKDKVILKVSSSCDLLLLLGWMLYMTDLFEVYNSSLLNEVQHFFSKFVAPEMVLGDPLKQQYKIQDDCKGDINDVIAAFKKVKHQYNKLVKLANYEKQQESITKKSVQALQGDLSYNEYQFLKKDENLESLAQALDKMKNTLEYENTHIRHREKFWIWLEEAVRRQKQQYTNDPDLNFEEEVSLEALRSFEELSFISLPAITKNLEGAFKSYEQFKDKVKDFNKIWEKESQALNLPENAKVYKELDKQKLSIIRDLEEKYPSLETLKKNLKGLGMFFGEIAAHLDSAFSEDKNGGSLEIQKISASIIESKRESDELKKQVEEVIKQYLGLLPRDIKVFHV